MIWNSLNDFQEFEGKLESGEKFGVFKHSTRCSISSMVKARLDKVESNFPVYLVKVVEERMLSNEIAEKSGVVHQSPQVLIFENGKCVFDASHMLINAQSFI